MGAEQVGGDGGLVHGHGADITQILGPRDVRVLYDHVECRDALNHLLREGPDGPGVPEI